MKDAITHFDDISSIGDEKSKSSLGVGVLVKRMKPLGRREVGGLDEHCSG